MSEGQQISLILGGMVFTAFCFLMACCFISRNFKCESDLVKGLMEGIRELPPEYRDSMLHDVDCFVAKRGYLKNGEVEDLWAEIHLINSELTLDKALTGNDEPAEKENR